MSFSLSPQNITGMTDLWGREGPTPGDDIVTDGGRRVNQWIVEQVTILRVKHSLGISGFVLGNDVRHGHSCKPHCKVAQPSASSCATDATDACTALLCNQSVTNPV
jgi:hypothetical protein